MRVGPPSDCKRAKVVGQCTCDCGQAQVGLSAHPWHKGGTNESTQRAYFCDRRIRTCPGSGRSCGSSTVRHGRFEHSYSIRHIRNRAEMVYVQLSWLWQRRRRSDVARKSVPSTDVTTGSWPIRARPPVLEMLSDSPVVGPAAPSCQSTHAPEPEPIDIGFMNSPAGRGYHNPTHPQGSPPMRPMAGWSRRGR
jgi:hypothetical protein